MVKYYLLQAVKAERQDLISSILLQQLVDKLKNEVAALEEKVRQGRVVAPADGTVYSLGRNDKSEPLKAGDYVKVGDLLSEMADLHKVRVRAFIDEPDLGGLEEKYAAWAAVRERLEQLDLSHLGDPTDGKPLARRRSPGTC